MNCLITLRRTSGCFSFLRCDRRAESAEKESWGKHLGIPGPSGNPISPDGVLHMFHRVLKRAGLPMVRFHDLRHSCATIMLYLGYTLKDIQTWLGHSNYNFTSDTYIHSGSGVHEQMAERLSEELKSLLPQNLENPILAENLSMC